MNFNDMVLKSKDKFSRRSIHDIKLMSNPKEARTFIIKWFIHQLDISSYPYLVVNKRWCLSLEKTPYLKDLIKKNILIQYRENRLTCLKLNLDNTIVKKHLVTFK